MSRHSRIPPPQDLGKYSRSTVGSLVLNLKDYQEKYKDDPLYDLTDRTACGYPLPSFQRQRCWTHEQSVKFLESLWEGYPVGTYTVHLADWGEGGKPLPYSGWLVDGQQRLTTIEEYLCDNYRVYGLLYSELTPVEKRRFKGLTFPRYEIEVWDEEKIRSLYNKMNFGGVAHKESERA